jgi:hypothetical protein
MIRLPIPRMVKRLSPRECAELFALANIAFLGVDIYVAHSINHFRYAAEAAPIIFSGGAAVVLAVLFLVCGLRPRNGPGQWVGIFVGVLSVVVGVAGLLFHLHSQFFEQFTLKSLVYTAPFVAPLAYAGIGLLLVLDRMVDSDSSEWAAWVILLAAGGFFGNFVLSLADHAQNGFFVWTEWIPVAAGALATTFLTLPLIFRIAPSYVRICGYLMVFEGAVGLAGFALHIHADLHGPTRSLRDNFLHGAPAFAPLLFPNLAMLAGIGLWSMNRNPGHTPAAESITAPA